MQNQFDLMDAAILTSRKKDNLPEKICPVCRRPFKWRKKWEKDWEYVLYCSERCRRNNHSCKTPHDDTD